MSKKANRVDCGTLTMLLSAAVWPQFATKVTTQPLPHLVNDHRLNLYLTSTTTAIDKSPSNVAARYTLLNSARYDSAGRRRDEGPARDRDGRRRGHAVATLDRLSYKHGVFSQRRRSCCVFISKVGRASAIRDRWLVPCVTAVTRRHCSIHTTHTVTPACRPAMW